MVFPFGLLQFANFTDPTSPPCWRPRFELATIKCKTIGPSGDLDVSNGNEILTSMDVDELEALADSKLAPSSQARLDQLLAENSERQLSGDEAKELDRLLAKIDQLTILKTRARYTLKQQAEATQQ